MGSATELDYVVVSAQWITKPSATLCQPWTPSPHTAILLKMPWFQPVVFVGVMRKPKTFLVRPPYGPFYDERIPSGAGNDQLCKMPVSNETLAAAASEVYSSIDTELATEYGVDLIDAKSRPTAGYGGRGTDLGRELVPVFEAVHGIAGGNHVSAFYRRLAARTREYIFMRDRPQANLNKSQICALRDLRISLPKGTPPEKIRPYAWQLWRRFVNRGPTLPTSSWHFNLVSS